jgi:WD40 repeat protein
MSGPAADHPPPERLPAFGLGLLSAEESAVIERHVAECDACCRSLLTVADDALVARLRQASSTSSDGLRAAEAPTQGLSAAGPSAPEPLPPELADHPRYRVEQLLGAGGMGAVYRAWHRVLGRPVALKVINPALTNKAAAVERFARESRAAARLSHPNIVAAFDAEQAGGTHFLVMEYVEGTDLARLVAEQGPLPVDRACEYVRQAALGLQHAFEQGMVHRDVKPHNLMLTPEGRVKILDFGLARFASEAASEAGLTGTGTVLGTVDYIAPEQADNAHQADVRADIYSLGCTLYHLLAGRPPFPTGTPVQRVMAHVEKTPQSLAELRHDIPEELMPVLERMTAKSPAARFQTPAEVAAALRPFTDPATLRARRKAAPGARPAPRRRRRGALAAAALALLLLGGGLAGVAVYRIRTDQGELVVQTEDADVEVVVSQGGRVVKIIDTKSGKQVTLRPGDYELALKDQPEGLKLSLHKFALKRGKTVVATVERQLAKPEEKAGEVRRFEGHEGPVRSVAFSPDGRYALSGSGFPQGDSTVRLWDVTSGKEVRRFTGHDGWVEFVAFSPDGKRALSSSFDRTVRLWDVETGRELRVFREHGGVTTGVAFTPDGKRALSASEDRTVRLWDLETGKELRQFKGHTHYVLAVSLAPDGRRFLSASWDGTVRLWDLETGQELRRYGNSTNALFAVAILPDGRRFLTGGDDGVVRLWDLEAGKEVRQFKGHTLQVYGLAVTRDGRRAMSAGHDGAVRLWDVEAGRQLHCFRGHREIAYSVTISPDGRHALSGGGGEFRDARWGHGTDWALRLWQLPDPAPAEKVGQVHLFEGHRDIVHGLAVSPDGRHAVSGGGYKLREGKLVDGAKDYDIRLWDLATRTEVRRLPGSGAAVYSVAFSPDGRSVLSGGGNPEGAIRLLDVATGKELRRSEGREHAVWSVAFSPHGRRALDAADFENEFRLRDVETGQEVRRFAGHTKPVRQVAFSPDGRHALSAGYDGTARLWDVESGKEAKRFEAHDAVAAVAISPDGRRLLTGGHDHGVRLWDVESGKELKRFGGHKGLVYSVAFSPDGRFALSAGGSFDAEGEEDFSLRLWGLESGKELHRFEGHTDVVTQVLWLPDGRHALSAGFDTTVRLWRLPDLPAADQR